MTTKLGRGSAAGLLLELAMIVVGVFLGTRAEQWRSDRQDREMARAALVNFRMEIARNEAEIRRVRGYHEQLGDSVDAFLMAPGPKSVDGFRRRTGFRGTRSIEFEHTAWDLALATQALAHIDPPLAYAVSRVYTKQQSFEAMEHAFMQGTFVPSTFADTANGLGLTLAMASYLGDVNTQEPDLLELYAEVLPQLDAALGGKPRATPVRASEKGPEAPRAAPTGPRAGS